MICILCDGLLITEKSEFITYTLFISHTMVDYSITVTEHPSIIEIIVNGWNIVTSPDCTKLTAVKDDHLQDLKLPKCIIKGVLYFNGMIFVLGTRVENNEFLLIIYKLTNYAVTYIDARTLSVRCDSCCIDVDNNSFIITDSISESAHIIKCVDIDDTLFLYGENIEKYCRFVPFRGTRLANYLCNDCLILKDSSIVTVYKPDGNITASNRYLKSRVIIKYVDEWSHLRFAD